MDVNVDHIPNIITACCVLYNICKVHGEAFVNTWMDDLPDNTDVPHSSTTRETIDSCQSQMISFSKAFFKK